MAVQARNVFRQSMRDLLASGPTQRQVHTRLLSLLRLHDELVRFVDWPALQSGRRLSIAGMQMRLPPVSTLSLPFAPLKTVA